MKPTRTFQTLAIVTIAALSTLACASNSEGPFSGPEGKGPASVQLGPRPFFLVNDMAPSSLQQKLQACAGKRRNVVKDTVRLMGQQIGFLETYIKDHGR